MQKHIIAYLYHKINPFFQKISEKILPRKGAERPFSLGEKGRLFFRGRNVKWEFPQIGACNFGAGKTIAKMHNLSFFVSADYVNLRCIFTFSPQGGKLWKTHVDNCVDNVEKR